MIISKISLLDSFKHDNIYEVPSNYDIPYINNITSNGEKWYLSAKRNVEYTWYNYIGKLGSFKYRELVKDTTDQYTYKFVKIELDNISDIYECSEKTTTNFAKLHECIGVVIIPNKISIIPIYSLIGYDPINNCWVIFSNYNNQLTENDTPDYYYNNLISDF